MTRKMGYRWLLWERMAEQGMWKTTELAPLLADRGIHLSAAQVYRLVSRTPERLSLPILAALCDILSCSPNDLIVPRAAGGGPVRGEEPCQRPRVAQVARGSRPAAGPGTW